MTSVNSVNKNNPKKGRQVQIHRVKRKLKKKNQSPSQTQNNVGVNTKVVSLDKSAILGEKSSLSHVDKTGKAHNRETNETENVSSVGLRPDVPIRKKPSNIEYEFKDQETSASEECEICKSQWPDGICDKHRIEREAKNQAYKEVFDELDNSMKNDPMGFDYNYHSIKKKFMGAGTK